MRVFVRESLCINLIELFLNSPFIVSKRNLILNKKRCNKKVNDKNKYSQEI